MGVYAVTGGSGGIGGEIVRLLKEKGNEVINIDVKNGDICGDLSTPEGRKEVVQQLFERCPEGLDGLACNAGVSGSCGNLPLIISLNYYGSVNLAVEAWPLLQKRKGRIVVTSSNTISQNARRTDISDMLVNGVSEDIVRGIVAKFKQNDIHTGHEIYVSTKYALARWARRMSSSSAARGVRINAVAPGNVKTAMTRELTGGAKAAVNALPIPTKFGGDSLMEPEEVANVICYLLSADSVGINGNIVFVDGGTDALLNSEKVY